MAFYGGKCFLLQFYLVMTICLAVGAGTGLKIEPGSFLPGVTTDVQMTCRPPPGEDIAKVLSLQLNRRLEGGLVGETLASYITSESPVVEVLGARLSASVSGSYDETHPKSAFLGVHLPQPTGLAEGNYVCSVEALDRYGVMHTYSGYASLNSLAKNKTTPAFYQAVLQELRTDLDTLTSDLQNVTDTQLVLANTDKEEQSKLSALDAEAARIRGLISDANSYVSNVDQKVTSLRTALDRLRGITPTTPVNFYAYVSSSYISPGVNNNIVFNVLEQHTDDSYSKSTGVFTVPVNGTYYFRTGITGNTDPTSASIVINDLPVASLISFDDYNLDQATASIIMALETGDTVRVVQKSGSRIYGYYPDSSDTHLSYFLGFMLW